MGTAALGLVWQTYANTNEMVSKLPYYIVSYGSAVTFVLLLALYLAKFIFYRHKVSNYDVQAGAHDVWDGREKESGPVGLLIGGRKGCLG